MKQLEHTYVTAKQFQHKQSQKGAKYTHKNCDFNLTLHALWRTDLHHDALHKTV